jgi:UrcA family protein
MKTCHPNALSAIFVAGLILTPLAGICAEPVPQVTVSFADMNLSNPPGISRLYQRLQWAAHKVCGSVPQARELSFHAAWSRCVFTALDDAVAQVHSAELAALHAKRTGQRTPLLVAKTTMEAR